ncbi:MAG: hypothetical protein ABSE73_09020 [Planctomycetota bacterium]
MWQALEALSGGRAVVTPTREAIGKAAGITRDPTISAALTTLEEAAWIDRVHVPVKVGNVQTATLLRITLHRRERKTFLTAHNPVENGKRSKGRERKAFQDSLKRERLPVSPAGEPSPPEEPNPEDLAPLDPKTGIPLVILEMQKRLQKGAVV